MPNLKLTKVKVNGVHKVLVINQDKARNEGRLITYFEAPTQGEALLHTIDFCKAVYKSDIETVWN